MKTSSSPSAPEGSRHMPGPDTAPEDLAGTNRSLSSATEKEGVIPTLSDTTIRIGSERQHAQFIRLWEASVRATHDFLTEEDLRFYQTFLPGALTEVDLFYLAAPDGKPTGFIGIAGDKIEMLFIHPSAQGKGLGTRLIDFAIHTKHARRVDVNEQNRRAALFYYKRGFELSGRDAEDGCGKPYPILHLQLKA